MQHFFEEEKNNFNNFLSIIEQKFDALPTPSQRPPTSANNIPVLIELPFSIILLNDGNNVGRALAIEKNSNFKINNITYDCTLYFYCIQPNIENEYKEKIQDDQSNQHLALYLHGYS